MVLVIVCLRCSADAALVRVGLGAGTDIPQRGESRGCPRGAYLHLGVTPTPV